MIHFGVIAPAFSSHFQVLQALASALVDKGHRVTFIHQADTRPFVTDPRIGFEAVGADTHPLGSLAHTIRAAANPGSPWGQSVRNVMGRRPVAPAAHSKISHRNSGTGSYRIPSPIKLSCAKM